jgi:predicted methyltransferase
MKLTQRERAALLDISSYRLAGYSKLWTPKTNEKLREKGLVEINDHSVTITQSGIEYLNNTR